MPKRRSVNRDYSDKLRAIRKYVEFDFDLRKPLASSQKRKINRYYDAIYAIQARANHVFRSSDKARVRTVQRYSRNEFEALPQIKVAFMEYNDGNTIEKIRFNERGEVSVTYKYFRMDFLEFDQERLAVDPDAEIAETLDRAEPAFTYRIAAGKYSIERPRSREQLPDEIKRLMNRYGMDPTLRAHKDEAAAENHKWENWLTGVIPLYVRNQDELREFRQRDEEMRRKRQKQRKAEREKRRRAKLKENSGL